MLRRTGNGFHCGNLDDVQLPYGDASFPDGVHIAVRALKGPGTTLYRKSWRLKGVSGGSMRLTERSYMTVGIRSSK